MSRFEENIQKWVSIDNQIKLVNEKLKELRVKKNDLTHDIIEHAEENEMMNLNIQQLIIQVM